MKQPIVLLLAVSAFAVVGCDEPTGARMGGASLMQAVGATSVPAGYASKIAFIAPDGRLMVMSADGSGLFRLSDSTQGVAPDWSPDGTRIAFARGFWRPGSGSDIYVVNSDGSSERRLTSDQWNDWVPQWSPDGSRLVFTRQIWAQTGWMYNLYTINADGTNEAPLMSSMAWTATWLPDGRIGYFAGSFGCPYCGDIFVMNPDASGIANITGTSDREIVPSWSPDGGRIAFYSMTVTTTSVSASLYVMNSDGTGHTRLSSFSFANVVQSLCLPAWSPDGSQIAIGVTGRIQIVNADGSGIRDVTSGSCPSWALVPDSVGPAARADVTPDSAAVGMTVRLTALLDDRMGGISAIIAAQYSLDDAPFAPLAARDGVLDGVVEEAELLLTARDSGAHRFCARGADIAGNVGPVDCVDFRFYRDDEPPVVTSVLYEPNPVSVGATAVARTTVDDRFSGGTPIATAAMSLDGGPYVAMAAVGMFDEPLEEAWAYIRGYPEPGVHEVCVEGSDAAGNVSTPRCELLAVYDPESGFVTGAGWINSPPGAFAADPTRTGKGIFAFVSRYQRGATVPDGNTQFRFQAAGLDFRSTSYQWLVIAGARAQFKGTGTIGGVGDYEFLLTAIDGQVNGGGGIDRFRIKIWDRVTGTIVYDNQMGDGDTSGAAMVLGAGAITIQAN